MIEKGYGASLVGAGHIKRNLPNQDCFLIDNNLDYTLVVVSDGVGSKKFPKYGSKTLCNTVKEVIRIFMKENRLKTKEELYICIDSVIKSWIKNLSPFKKEESSCTCLFVVVTKTNIITFQLGDGLIAIKENDKIIQSNLKNDEFLNVTKSISNCSFSDWNVNVIKKDNKTYKILLCTDGVSEDLKENSLDYFIDLVSNKITNKKDKQKNNIELKNILISWPNIFGLDDKTIAMVV